MATSLVDRLTAAIRVADQSMQAAQYQADYRNWHEVHRVLQDVRDELQKPAGYAEQTQSAQGLNQAAPNQSYAAYLGSGLNQAAAAQAQYDPRLNQANVAQPVKRGPGRPRKEAA